MVDIKKMKNYNREWGNKQTLVGENRKNWQ